MLIYKNDLTTRSSALHKTFKLWLLTVMFMQQWRQHIWVVPPTWETIQVNVPIGEVVFPTVPTSRERGTWVRYRTTATIARAELKVNLRISPRADLAEDWTRQLAELRGSVAALTQTVQDPEAFLRFSASPDACWAARPSNFVSLDTTWPKCKHRRHKDTRAEQRRRGA